MPSCSFKTCKNTSRKNKNVRYFLFPKNTEMIEKWKIFCKENVNPNNGMYIILTGGKSNLTNNKI